MRDSTEFRQRFAAWKAGNKVYDAGKPVEDDYEKFKQTLPPNQRNASEYEYSTRRYWELGGKPKDFDEAVKRKMYTLEKDGFYHAKSIAWNPEGDAEFMKPNVHPTKHFEDEFYESNPEFLKKYRRTFDWTRPGFSKYERNINPLDYINLPKYDDGTDDKTYLPEYEYEATVTPQGTSLEKHKRITNEEDWLKYWGDVGAGYVNKALNEAAPYVLNGMSVLMGNPIGAFAGIAGGIAGEDIGAHWGPTGRTVGGLIGGTILNPDGLVSVPSKVKNVYNRVLPYLHNEYKAYKLTNAINRAVKENPIITGYNRNPALKDIGDLWDYQNYLELVYPNTLIKDVVWHGSRIKDLQEFSTEAIGSNTPIKGSTGMYLTPYKSVADSYGKRGGVYPVLLNSENPYITRQIFALPRNGVNVARISPKVKNTVLANNDAVVAPQRGEIAFFNPNNALILGSKHDMLAFSRFARGNKPKFNPNELTKSGDVEINNPKTLSNKELVLHWNRIVNDLSIDKKAPQNVIDLFDNTDLPNTAKSGVEKFVLRDPNNPQYVLKKHRGVLWPKILKRELEKNAVLNDLQDLVLPTEYIGSQKIAGEGYVPYFRQLAIKSLDGRDAALAGKEWPTIQRQGYEAFKNWLDTAKQNPKYSVEDGRVITLFGHIGDVGPQGNIGIDANGNPFAFDPMLFDADWKKVFDYLYGSILYDKGKSIHIKPANRGKFNATKKRTGKTTEQLAHSKNPLTRKRAIFALNSRKFKH